MFAKIYFWKQIKCLIHRFKTTQARSWLDSIENGGVKFS